MDNGKVKNYGAAIDNVGIYEWKTNELCQIEEVEAVGAGNPVQYSAFYNGNHVNYQLDSAKPGHAYVVPIPC